MAYVNVKEWSPDQVTEWLRGLDNVILPYINSFLNNEVKGHQLLNLRSDDLEHLGVHTLGHQELILEAVEHLRNFHYELDRENLQLLALRLSCAAQSLYRELVCVTDTSKVETQTMSDVSNIITFIKPLVCWLDRAPFNGQFEYTERKSKLLHLSLTIATVAQRDRFSEQPVAEIRSICHDLVLIADNIIQEISDPMILQPASLDLATLKKKENELGFSLMPSFHGIHQITDIKFASPAHQSNKLEDGDEIVQVNYQTVVGWQRKKVLGLFQESPPDIVLTLKKRPRHTKVYGQIYMKPYRLPSKKRAVPYTRWGENLPSPRPELLTIPDFDLPMTRLAPIVQQPPLESESSSDSEPPDSPLESQRRIYPLKPRPVLQRRNTITGASPTSKRPHHSIEQYWNELKHQAAYKHSSSTYIETDNYNRDSVYLRDKSASCGHGLERPVTYPKQFDKSLLMNGSSSSENKNTTDVKKKVNFHDKKIIFDEKVNEIVPKTITINSSEMKRELSCIKEISGSSKDIELSTILKDSNFVNSSLNLNSQPSGQISEKSISINSLTLVGQSEEPIRFIDETVDEMYDRSHMNPEWKNEIIEEIIVTLKKSCFNSNDGTVNNTTPSNSPDKSMPDKTIEIPHTSNLSKDNIIQKVPKPAVIPRNQVSEPKVFKKPPEVPAKPDILRKPAVPPRNFNTKITRGKLDKCHSTPAYDTTQQDIEKIEKTVLPKYQTPEILVTAPEINEASTPSFDHNSLDSRYDYSAIDHPYTQIEYHTLPQGCETTPVVATINSALGSFKENVENTYQQNKSELDSNKSLSKNVPYTHDNIDNAKQKLHGHTPKMESNYGVKVAESPPEPPPRTIYMPNLDISIKKNFDPKLISTPITKTPTMDFPSVDNHKAISDVTKSNSETKISPTNSVVRAIIYSNKSKTGKKKTALLAKRRKVTVKDLIPCEIQGYLFQRSRHKHNQNVPWERRWFVLTGSYLYGFNNKDATKADCLIYLTGYTVAIAQEVKSRSNAFKVYHTGTVFYFSAENSETMNSWVELITAATHLNDTLKPADVLFSETDESDSEKPKTDGKEKSETSRKFGSLKKITSRKSSNDKTTHSESTSLDRKYLRFFNNSSSKTSKNVPVPTPQFRSYRKVVPPNLIVTQNLPTSPQLVNVPKISKPEPPKLESSSRSSSNLNLDVDTKSDTSSTSSKVTKLKIKPINYMHASNPSLCDTNDYRIANFYHRTRQFTQRSENLAGFVTLEQFMLNRQEEDRRQNLLLGRHDDIQINPNSIQPDVVYGEVPYGDNRNKKKDSDRKYSDASSKSVDIKKYSHSRNNSDVQPDMYYEDNKYKHRKHSSDETYKASVQSRTLPKSEKLTNDIQNRSLPRTTDKKDGYTFYEEQSELVSDVKMSEPYELLYADKKTLKIQSSKYDVQNLREKSYELIYCPQKVNDVQFAQNRTLDGQKNYCGTPKKPSKLIRQHSLNSSDKKDKIFNRGESPEKFWLDSLRRNDKISDKSNSKVKLKSATQYTPICLPLTPDQKGKLNPKFAFELNLDEKSSKSGKRLKSFFGNKSDEKKEKTLLGSPRLHRAFFRKHNNGQESDWSSETPQVAPYSTNLTPNPSPRIGLSNSPSSSFINSPPPDYPGLEYPPVFEPETYSLANPSCSLTLLKKQQK